MLGEASEEPIEITASELPGEGSGRLLVTLLEGDEAFGQSVEVGEVVGGQNLALEHREVDLDLIEPGGMNRKVQEPQIRPGALQALDGGFTSMGGAVVHDPEHAISGGVVFLSHHLLNQRAEGLDAVLRLATTEKLSPVHVPGGQVSQSPLAFVLVLYAHRLGFTRGRLGRMAAATGLDGGLLVGGDHILSLSESITLPPTLVEVQHSPGFVGEVGVPREDPGAVVKGPDGILGEPSPDGGSRDLGHKTPSHRLARHLGGTPAAQRNPAGRRQLTSEGLHLRPCFGGKRAAVCQSGADPPVHPIPPRKSAYATYRPPGGWCKASGRS